MLLQPNESRNELFPVQLRLIGLATSISRDLAGSDPLFVSPDPALGQRCGVSGHPHDDSLKDWPHMS